MISILTNFAAACGGNRLLGFPTWYNYLPCVHDPAYPADPTKMIPQLTSLSDIWLIAMAVLDILLRLAALATIAFIVYGGVLFITSSGDPEKTAKARSTTINAVIGLILAVGATAVVTFVAGRFKPQ